MSINVTVRGNPISIKRGRMVSSGRDFDPKELRRRRLIRLEQVRQQSKEIAGNIRKKIKGTKLKQQTEAEKECSANLERWQAEKLLELQNQYRDCLEKFGLGHKQAALEPDVVEELKEKLKKNDEAALKRGKAAASLVLKERNTKKEQEKVAADKKFHNKTVETTRAALASSPVFRKRKKKPSVPRVATPEMKPQLEQSVLSTSSETTPKKCRPETSYGGRSPSRSINTLRPRSDSPDKKEIQMQTDVNMHNYPISSGDAGFFREQRFSSKIRQRISKRNLDIISQPICDIKSTCFEYPLEPRPTPVQSFAKKTCPCHAPSTTCRASPTKSPPRPASMHPPTRRLARPSPRRSPGRPMAPRLPEVSDVAVKSPRRGRTDLASVDVHPRSQESEEEFLAQMLRRERVAQERGRRAIERVKVQRECQKLLKELPTINKQQIIDSMQQQGTRARRQHLSQERLKQMEKLKQDRIANAFERIYSGSDLDREVERSQRSQRSSLEASPTQLDVGSWEKAASAPAQAKRSTKVSGPTRDDIRALLDRIRVQKGLLLKETNSLPKVSKLQELLEDESLLLYLEDKQRKSSPGKKQKIRSEATQTSPINVLEVAAKKSSSVRCCKDTSSYKYEDDDDVKLCEIIIKLCDKVDKISQPTGAEGAGKPSPKKKAARKTSKLKASEKSPARLAEPLIKVSPIKDSPTKASPTKGSPTKGSPIKGSSPKKTFPKKAVRKQPRRDASWMSSLLKSDSTSTSYFSPPEMTARSKPTPAQATPGSLIKPKLMAYMQKLLAMSRQSLDELGVSSSSTVATPTASVIETEKNRAKDEIRQMANCFDLLPADMVDCIDAYNNGMIDEHADEYLRTNYPHLLRKYADVAENCCARISNLAAMIEKVRQEKRRILESPLSDQNGDSTSYLTLTKGDDKKGLDTQTTAPSGPKRSANDAGKDQAASPAESPLKNAETSSDNSEQEKLDRYLLNIDYGQGSKAENVVFQEIPVRDSSVESSNSDNFVPILQDIPLLPEEKLPILFPAEGQLEKNGKQKPPAAIYRNMMRHDLGQEVVPHELSTIAEVDTAMSSRVLQAKDSSKASNTFVDAQPVSTPSPNHEQLAEPQQPCTTDTSSSESVENMESILKKLGMEWAIATLRKTKEAMALSSSSSSEKLLPGSAKVTTDESGKKDKSQRKTSTPIQTTKSENSAESKDLFASGSDLSSVKATSTDNPNKTDCLNSSLSLNKYQVVFENKKVLIENTQ